MKTEFEKAEVEIIRFDEKDDVITTSTVTIEGSAGDNVIDDGDEN